MQLDNRYLARIKPLVTFFQDYNVKKTHSQKNTGRNSNRKSKEQEYLLDLFSLLTAKKYLISQ